MAKHYYWLCPKPEAPSGGVWLIHRLAELANLAGLPSLVIQKEPFTVWWDAHPIDPGLIAPPNLDLFGKPAESTFIVPEGNWHDVSLPEGSRAICFLQNYIWLNREHWAQHPGEISVCSRYLYNWCERELGITPIGIVNPFLDDDVWAPSHKVTGRVLLLKRRTDLELIDRVQAMLKRNGLTYQLLEEPQSQRSLATFMDPAEYYLHLVEPEGFPMICLEAMRSGTLVVGTTGGGGNEFMFDGQTAMTVAGPKLSLDPNLDHFVDGIEAKLKRLLADDVLRSQMWQKAYAWSKRYTAAETTKQLRRVLT